MVVLKGFNRFPQQWQENCHACPFWQDATMNGPGYCVAKYAVHGFDAVTHNGSFPCPFGDCAPYKEDLDRLKT